MPIFTDLFEINENADSPHELLPGLTKERCDDLAIQIGDIQRKFDEENKDKKISIIKLLVRILKSNLAKNDMEQMFILITVSMFIGGLTERTAMLKGAIDRLRELGMATGVDKPYPVKKDEKKIN